MSWKRTIRYPSTLFCPLFVSIFSFWNFVWSCCGWWLLLSQRQGISQCVGWQLVESFHIPYSAVVDTWSYNWIGLLVFFPLSERFWAWVVWLHVCCLIASLIATASLLLHSPFSYIFSCTAKRWCKYFSVLHRNHHRRTQSQLAIGSANRSRFSTRLFSNSLSFWCLFCLNRNWSGTLLFLKFSLIFFFQSNSFGTRIISRLLLYFCKLGFHIQSFWNFFRLFHIWIWVDLEFYLKIDWFEMNWDLNWII